MFSSASIGGTREGVGRGRFGTPTKAAPVYVQQTFSPGADAPGAAREALDAALRDRVAPDALAELRLLVSELMTNAVRHGPSDGGSVELAVALRGDVARIEVVDGGGGFDPPGGTPTASEPGGWGLVVVDRLASRWGVEGGPRTLVWAEVPLCARGACGGGPTEPVYARNV